MSAAVWLRASHANCVLPHGRPPGVSHEMQPIRSIAASALRASCLEHNDSTRHRRWCGIACSPFSIVQGNFDHAEGNGVQRRHHSAFDAHRALRHDRHRGRPGRACDGVPSRRAGRRLRHPRCRFIRGRLVAQAVGLVAALHHCRAQQPPGDALSRTASAPPRPRLRRSRSSSRASARCGSRGTQADISRARFSAATCSTGSGP